MRRSGPIFVKHGIELLGVATNSWVPTQLSSYEELACSDSLPAIAYSVGVLYRVAQNHAIPVIIFHPYKALPYR
jgi:hypothetical protein